jgi:hypothetical protein
VAAKTQPTLWRNLVAAMADKGLRPKDLADRLEWASVDPFFKWKNTPRRISRTTLQRLSEVLHVAPEALDPAGEAWDEENREGHVRSDSAGRYLSELPNTGGDMPQGADGDLFAELVGYWQSMSGKRDRRQELVDLAYRLAAPGHTPPERARSAGKAKG